MGDPILATRPLIPFLQDWLATHAGSIRQFSKAVGVKPSLIVSGPLQEASTILTPEGAIVQRWEVAPGTFERTKDFLADNYVKMFGHNFISDVFHLRRGDIIKGETASVPQKLIYPTGNDIGYGNIGNTVSQEISRSSRRVLG